MSGLRSALGLLALTLLGCAPGQTAMVLELDVAESLRAEVGSVEITARSGERLDPDFYYVFHADELTWPLILFLEPEDEAAVQNLVRVDAIAFREDRARGEVVVRERVEASYVPGEIAWLRAPID